MLIALYTERTRRRDSFSENSQDYAGGPDLDNEYQMPTFTGSCILLGFGGRVICTWTHVGWDAWAAFACKGRKGWRSWEGGRTSMSINSEEDRPSISEPGTVPGSFKISLKQLMFILYMRVETNCTATYSTCIFICTKAADSLLG